MTTFVEKAEAMELPLIALRGTVAFPAVQLNLEIMRGFSLKAFSQGAAEGGRVFLLAQKNPEADKPEEKDFYRMGTVAQIRHVVKSPDGNLSVVFEGICRAKLISLSRRDGYFQAQVVAKAVRSATIPTSHVEALRASADRIMEELAGLHPSFTSEMRASSNAIGDCGTFADFVASAALIDYKAKQAILETLNPITRLEKLLYLVDEEIRILRCENEINRKVRANIEDNQRDYFLREQMKVIQQELGDDTDEIEEYADKIERLHLPEEIDRKLQKELGRLAKTPFGAPESTVLRNYLDACLEVPWNKRTSDKVDIERAKEILDADHEGLDKVKERILEYIAVKALSPDVKNQILCLIGPPGTGKTSVAASIARAMHRKYARISLGGIRDEADIRGHRKTYVGAMPGRIVEAVTTAGVLNPVIVLDEIDKLTADAHGDPSSALLEVLDPEQNKYFRDHFLELPLDLSDCVFIATANGYDGIPAPLLDRMEVIDIQSYSENEKVAIAEKHLLPKQLKRHGLTKRQFRLPEETLRALIRRYTREAGVRNLEREIASLIRKAARKIAEGEIRSVTVKPDDLFGLLGKPKVYDELPEQKDTVGVVNGLAYTQSGGDLLPVEVRLMSGQGKLELTGSLGDVMRESASIALSYVRSVASVYGISDEAFKNRDIHIHFPEGATPKDGPSAGAAVTVALISAFSGRPVRCDVAMTGEMTLRGRILPIGGLREKTFAAARCGVYNVILPEENRVDLDEVDSAVKEKLHFFFVSDFSEIPPLCLREAPAADETAGDTADEAAASKTDGRPDAAGKGEIPASVLLPNNQPTPAAAPV